MKVIRHSSLGAAKKAAHKTVKAAHLAPLGPTPPQTAVYTSDGQIAATIRGAHLSLQEDRKEKGGLNSLTVNLPIADVERILSAL